MNHNIANVINLWTKPSGWPPKSGLLQILSSVSKNLKWINRNAFFWNVLLYVTWVLFKSRTNLYNHIIWSESWCVDCVVSLLFVNMFYRIIRIFIEMYQNIVYYIISTSRDSLDKFYSSDLFPSVGKVCVLKTLNTCNYFLSHQPLKIALLNPLLIVLMISDSRASKC